MRRLFALAFLWLLIAAPSWDGTPGFAGKTPPGGGSKTMLSLPFNGNGGVLATSGSQDLWLVGDDAAAGADWSGHGGTSFVAAHTGSPSTGIESPFYPSGGFAGSGFRKAVGGIVIGSTQYTVAASSAHNFDTDVTIEWLIKCPSEGGSGTVYGRKDATRTLGDLTWDNTNKRVTFNLGFSTTSIAASSAANSAMNDSYVLVTLVYTNSTLTAQLYIDGAASGTASTGVGTVETSNTEQLGIGHFEFSGGDTQPYGGQIIEVMRHKGLAMSAATVAQRFQVLAGVRDALGTYPAVVTRPTANTYLVNGKLWRVGPAFPRIDLLGYYAEANDNNYLKDSTFTQATLATNWVVTAMGTTTVAYDSALSDCFSTTGGKSAKILTDASHSDGEIAQNVTLSVSHSYVLSADWESPNSGVLNAAIQNQTTLNFLQSNGTWAASNIPIAFGTSTASRRRDSIAFTTEASGTSFSVYIGNAAAVGNASTTLYVFHAQLEDGSATTSRIITTSSAPTVRNGEQLEFANSVIDVTHGLFLFTFTPDNSNAPSVQAYLSAKTSAYTCYTNSAGNQLSIIDPSSNLSAIADPMTAGTSYRIACVWGHGRESVTDVTTGIAATPNTAFTGSIGPNNICIGCQTGAAGLRGAYGHFSGVTINNQ